MRRLLASAFTAIGLLFVGCSGPLGPDLVSGGDSPLSKGVPSWAVLSKGDQGTNVTALQYLLTVWGYTVTVDGDFGDGTLEAVKNFQAKKGLVSDGVVGENTWKKLIVTVNRGDKGGAVKAVQYLLRYKFEYTKIGVDGDFGAYTATCVETFKNNRGLGSGATVGETTWQYLIGEKAAGGSFWGSRSDWTHPVRGGATMDPTTGARYFGASRAGGRYHAGVDFYAANGTTIWAMTDGKVIAVYDFYKGTDAVEILNSDGTIARYCEIGVSVSVGQKVSQGQKIGSVKAHPDGTMLHFEMYMGTAKGALTDRDNASTYDYVSAKNYQRRRDLVDPMGARFLKIKH